MSEPSAPDSAAANPPPPMPPMPVPPVPVAPGSPAGAPVPGQVPPGYPAQGPLGWSPPPAPGAPQRQNGPQPRAAGPAGLGLVALILAVVALTAPSVAAAMAAFAVGDAVGPALTASGTPADDLSILSPVRGWVLLGELAFWAGTVVGVWAIVQGAIAIARRRGRGQGVAAVVIAPLGFIVFLTVASGFFFVGVAGSVSFGP